MKSYDFEELTPEEREAWEQEWRGRVAEELAKRRDEIIYNMLKRENPKNDVC